MEIVTPADPSSNRGPTFRLVLRERYVYEQNSDTLRKYNVTVKVSTSTFPSVLVNIGEIAMSNIVPSIERISSGEAVVPLLNNPSDTWLKSQDPSLLLSSDEDNPIDTVVTGNVGID